MTRPTYIKDIIDDLSADTDIIGIVSSSNIFASWRRKKITFPCIVIQRIDGSEMPQLGSSNSGWTKSRPVFRIDVATRDSAYQAAEVMGYIKDILLGSGYEKMTEFDDYSNKYEAYIRSINVRLTSVYSF